MNTLGIQRNGKKKFGYAAPRPCQTCGQSFRPTNSALKKGKGRFCSLKCRPKQSRDRVPISCISCGKTFEVKRYRAEVAQFCSNQCRATGEHSNRWGGGIRHDAGYIYVANKNHPRSVGGYVAEHILIAERALGKPLPSKAVVHHVDENPSNNCPDNLVICENNAYHRLIHARQRVVELGGDPRLHKVCCRCKIPKTFVEFNSLHSGYLGLSGYCRACSKKNWAEYRVNYA